MVMSSSVDGAVVLDLHHERRAGTQPIENRHGPQRTGPYCMHAPRDPCPGVAPPLRKPSCRVALRTTLASAVSLTSEVTWASNVRQLRLGLAALNPTLGSSGFILPIFCSACNGKEKMRTL